MKTFGFKSPVRVDYFQLSIKRVSFLYIGILFLCYIILMLYSGVSTIVLANNKLEAFKTNLQDLSIVFWSTDKDLSKFFLSADNLMKNYSSGGNVLKKNQGDIIYTLNYLKNNRQKFKIFGIETDKYKDAINFFMGLDKYLDEGLSLLGKDEAQNYLIVLQNTNEKRPNGGFFGSFGLLTLDAGHFSFDIIDSYYLNYISSGVYLDMPAWAQSFMPDEKIGFIAGNKFGFSDIDGENLKKLYEKTFPEQKIRGVVFVRSDFFEQHIPGLQKMFWEWQFVNSSIDLIRGEKLPNKKEYYLDDIGQYISNNKVQLIDSVLQNFDSLRNNSNLTIYLTGISQDLEKYISKNKLSNTMQDNKIYFWDYNRAFDKIDSFVEKNISIEDMSGNILSYTKGDIVDISTIDEDEFVVDIFYDIVVPKDYEDFIHELEKEYLIELTYREKYILGLEHVWKDEGLIYFPKNYKITDFSGDYNFIQKFETPFSNNFRYKIKSDKNNNIKHVYLKFKRI